jgi:hypothetical protein
MVLLSWFFFAASELASKATVLVWFMFVAVNVARAWPGTEVRRRERFTKTPTTAGLSRPSYKEEQQKQTADSRRREKSW